MHVNNNYNIEKHAVLSPGLHEIGPVSHHFPAELDLLGLVVLGRVQRVAEHVADLVAVHHARPLGPRVVERPVLEVVHVHVVAGDRVLVRELVDVARELIVADHLVERVPVLDRVVRVQPVRVLKLDGRPDGRVRPRVQLAHGLDEVLPRHQHVLLLLEQLREVVEYRVVALLRVAAHQYVGLLEVAGGQGLLRIVVQERAVHDGHEREEADAHVVPLLLHDRGAVDGAQARDRAAHVRAVRGAPDGARQPQPAVVALLPGQYRPRRRRRPGLHDGLVEQVPAERRQQVQRHGHGAGGLAEQRHVVRVAAEQPDVVVHPLQRHQLVEQARVPGHVLRVEVQEPEGRDAVLHGHQDDVLLRHQDLRVVDVQRRGPGVKAAAEDPHHDRGVGGPRLGHHHVDVQTVLGHGRVGVPHGGPGEVAEQRVEDLHASVGRRGAVEHGVRVGLVPAVHGARVSEPQVTCNNTRAPRRAFKSLGARAGFFRFSKRVGLAAAF